MDKPSQITFAPITRREWRFVWLVGLGILLVTSLPYLFGYATTPADKQFMGLMQDVPDHGQYLAWWRSFQSSFLVPNKLTPEPNPPVFFNLMWWALAMISKATGWGYPVIYQILRWAAGLLLFGGVYRLLAVFFREVSWRRLAFLLVALSAGFGWMLVVIKYALSLSDLPYPLLAYDAEANYFLCLLGYPHFALAAGLIALILEFVYRGYKTGRMRDFLAAAALAVALGWMHAYDLLIIYGVTGLFFLCVWISRRKIPARFFWGEVLVGVLSAPAAVYSYLLTTLDPLWKEVLSQFSNAGVYTPAPPYLFFLMGVPLFLAAAALVHWFRQKKWTDERLFITGWFGIGFLLLYIPTDFQIHMLNSWQIPVMMLATAALYEVVAPWAARRRARPVFGMSAAQALAALLLLSVLPTNLYLFSWRFVELARHTYPFYLEKDYVRALDWLAANTRPEQIVLSSLTVGQYIPAVSSNTAFLAHWANTVNFYDKEERVSQFFDAAAPDAQRIQTVSTFQVDYIVAGPAERELGSYAPGHAGWLKPVFETPSVTVYQVVKERLADGGGGN